MVPFRGMFRLRNERHVATLNIFSYAHGVRHKYSGSAEDIFLNLQYMVVCLLLRFAEVSGLKERKSTANCSLTVSGVARCYPTATSERGRGWVGYLPLNYNARSEASEHALARRVIPRQDPLHKLPLFGALSDCLFHSGDFGNNINPHCFFSVMFVGVFHSYFFT